MPQIGFGKNGFSLGPEIGVGGKGIFSASLSIGFNFKSDSFYWSTQGIAAGFYAGYGSNGAFGGFGYSIAGAVNIGVNYSSAGWGVGVGIGGSSNSLNGGMYVGWSEKGGLDWGSYSSYNQSWQRSYDRPGDNIYAGNDNRYKSSLTDECPGCTGYPLESVTIKGKKPKGWLGTTSTLVGGVGTFGSSVENTAGKVRIGSNWKTYWSGWGGNQYVSTLSVTKAAKMVGTATLAIGTTLDFIGVTYYYTEGSSNPNSVGPVKAVGNLGVGVWGLLSPATAIGAGAYWGMDTFYPGGFSGAMDRTSSLNAQHYKMTGQYIWWGGK